MSLLILMINIGVRGVYELSSYVMKKRIQMGGKTT